DGEPGARRGAPYTLSRDRARRRTGTDGRMTAPLRPAQAHTAVRLGIIGGLVTAALLGAFFVRAAQYGSAEGTPYVVGFPTSGALNVMLAPGDGQAVAALATDPSLSRPQQFAGQTADTRVGVEAAYRAQRPL